MPAPQKIPANRRVIENKKSVKHQHAKRAVAEESIPAPKIEGETQAAEVTTADDNGADDNGASSDDFDEQSKDDSAESDHAEPAESEPAEPTESEPAESEPAEPTESEPAESEPVDHVESEPAEHAEPAESEPVEHAKRFQVGKSIDIDISSARVRRHIDRLNLNLNVDNMSAAIKKEIAAADKAKQQNETGRVAVSDDPTAERDITPEEREHNQAIIDAWATRGPELHQQLSALSRSRTRFSNEAAITLTIVCNSLIRQIAKHTMQKSIEAKKKIIQLPHLFQTGIEEIPLYPLIKNLPTFVAAQSEYAAKRALEETERSRRQLLATAEKEFKAKYGVTGKKAKEAAEPEVRASPHKEAAEPDEDAATQCDDDKKISFKHYVGNVVKSIAEETGEPKTNISTCVRQFLSDILIEFIHRISSLVHLTSTCMKNKTISDTVILRTVEAILIDGHDWEEKIEFEQKMVADPASAKAENERVATLRAAGEKAEVVAANIKMVPRLVAIRTFTYPTSGFTELVQVVQEKLALYNKIKE